MQSIGLDEIAHSTNSSRVPSLRSAVMSPFSTTFTPIISGGRCRGSGLGCRSLDRRPLLRRSVSNAGSKNRHARSNRGCDARHSLTTHSIPLDHSCRFRCRRKRVAVSTEPSQADRPSCWECYKSVTLRPRLATGVPLNFSPWRQPYAFDGEFRKRRRICAGTLVT